MDAVCWKPESSRPRSGYTGPEGPGSLLAGPGPSALRLSLDSRIVSGSRMVATTAAVSASKRSLDRGAERFDEPAFQCAPSLCGQRRERLRPSDGGVEQPVAGDDLTRQSRNRAAPPRCTFARCRASLALSRVPPATAADRSPRRSDRVRSSAPGRTRAHRPDHTEKSQLTGHENAPPTAQPRIAVTTGVPPNTR